jgi:hypothetical protein
MACGAINGKWSTVMVDEPILDDETGEREDCYSPYTLEEWRKLYYGELWHEQMPPLDKIDKGAIMDKSDYRKLYDFVDGVPAKGREVRVCEATSEALSRELCPSTSSPVRPWNPFGVPILLDKSVPVGEVRFVRNGECVGKIVGLEVGSVNPSCFDVTRRMLER